MIDVVFSRSENGVLIFEWLAQEDFINETFKPNTGLMALGPIWLYKGLGVEYTTLPMFFPMILILVLLISGALFRNYFEPNTTVLLTKGTVVHLTIPE